jgi:hypothetical protein
MRLTRSFCCRRLSFSNAASCPHCGKGFPPGSLDAKATQEDKAFDQRSHALFLIAFLVLPLMPFFIPFTTT